MIGSTCGSRPKRTASRLGAAACQHRFPRTLLGGFDRFRKQLAERAGIGHRDRENSRKRPEADDADKDQRPDQGVDTADGVEAAADGEANDGMRRGIFRRQEADRKCDDGRNQGAEERDRQRLAHRLEQEVEVTAGRRRKHQRDEFCQRCQSRPDLVEGNGEPPCRENRKTGNTGRRAASRGGALKQRNVEEVAVPAQARRWRPGRMVRRALIGAPPGRTADAGSVQSRDR